MSENASSTNTRKSERTKNQTEFLGVDQSKGAVPKKVNLNVQLPSSEPVFSQNENDDHMDDQMSIRSVRSKASKSSSKQSRFSISSSKFNAFFNKMNQIDARMIDIQRNFQEQKKDIELLKRPLFVDDCENEEANERDNEKVRSWILNGQSKRGEDIFVGLEQEFQDGMMINEPLKNEQVITSSPNLVNQSVNEGKPARTSSVHFKLSQDREHSTMNDTKTININHYAARQTFSKDLPSFSGNPLDWPKFISFFESSSEICGYSDAENIWRLENCLKGDARHSVRLMLGNPACVTAIMKTLKLKFGRPEHIIRSLMEQVKNIPRPRLDKLNTVIDFCSEVQNLVINLEHLKARNHLFNPILIEELVNKLPEHMLIGWALFIEEKEEYSLRDLSRFLMGYSNPLSKIAKPVFNFYDKPRTNTYPQVASSTSKGFSQVTKPSYRSNVHVESGKSDKLELKPNDKSGSKSPKLRKRKDSSCWLCKSKSHMVIDCDQYKNMDLNERWDVVRAEKVCFCCLNSNHHVPGCNDKKPCDIGDCKRYHHKSLHREENIGSSEVITTHHLSTSHDTDSKSTVLLKIVPVKLFGNGKIVETTALLDDGSSISLMDETLAKELELEGTSEPLCLKWTGETIRKEENSERVSFKISGLSVNCKLHEMYNVRTVKSLALPIQKLDSSVVKNKFKHLTNIPLKSFNSAPRLLIGIDHWKLGHAKFTKEGKEGEPVAINTKLGWVLFGKSELKSNSNLFSINVHICDCQSNDDQKLINLVEDFIVNDDLLVNESNVKAESDQVLRARKLLHETTRRVGSRYETGLLWNSEEIEFPDCTSMALRRLKCVEQKMARSKEFELAYKAKVAEYISKGYARQLSDDELAIKHKRIWILPHFGVINPNKPGKFRWVFDAAAEFNGVSLNSKLLVGPDLYNSILGVLFKFRERAIAFSGDIREFFHQILMREEDRHSLRFIFRDDPSGPVKVYEMLVMIFGSACSPSSAQYVKNVNAHEFAEDFPRAADAIVKRHYMDDYLDSVDTIEEAINLIKEVTNVHKRGGFEIVNFISNSEEVMKAINDEVNVSETKSMNLAKENERILGMMWNIKHDTLTFALCFHKVDKKIVDGIKIPTKREVLKLMMSVYDPLGLLANFLVYVKIFYQTLWSFEIGWDEKIPIDLVSNWQLWLKVLNNVSQVSIPRCYSLQIPKSTSIQLHIFVDASEKAYAAVSYIRIVHNEGVEVALIAAKTRVAPRKIMSIPRLELQSAVLGTRLAVTVCKEHALKFEEVIFWSDSRTVLLWLRSQERQYKPFVAHRVREILNRSTIDQWFKVPSLLNVADDATKWNEVPNFDKESRWFSGPEFLRKNSSEWPKNLEWNGERCEEELRTCCVNVHNEVDDLFSYPDLDKFSKFERFVRCMAYAYRFVQWYVNWKRPSKREKGVLKIEELREGEKYLWRKCQAESFQDEIQTLREGKELKKSSAIYRLCPYLDEDGLLRMRGRIDAAPSLSVETKRPIILQKSHRIVFLLVDYYHRRRHHQATQTVLNDLQLQFCIPKVRSTLRKVYNECNYCKVARAQRIIPPMGNLPLPRVNATLRPFSSTGLDPFGPYTITVGRRKEKRWGLLFTCLAIRAVHIEILYSMDTSSAIMAIRNFLSRFPMTREFHSDNGTNLVGAEREMREAFLEIDFERVQFECSREHIKWYFIPPASPHFGGAWERLVRSIKSSLRVTLKENEPSDEVFRTVLKEAERLVNSRPLTEVPVDEADEPALTPYSFLLGEYLIEPAIAPGDFSQDKISRRKWRESQVMIDHFWSRWVKEYLPTLARRSKWYQKAEPLKVGDLVWLADEKKRDSWQRGRVVKIYCGLDKQVRVVDVETKTGIYKRPSVKIAPFLTK